MLQPSLRTAGDICRPALYGIYLLEATANQLTSRSRRRRKMLAKAKRWREGGDENEDGDGSRRRVGRQSSQVATTKELERKRRLYKVVMCLMRLGFWRRFGFDAVFHSFAYGYVCICVCAAHGEQTRMRIHAPDTRVMRNLRTM